MNPYHDKMKPGKGPMCSPGVKSEKMPMKTAAWAGLPGKTQPRSRDKKNTPKVRQSVRIEGL